MYYLIDDDENDRYDDIESLLEFLVPDDMFSDCQDDYDTWLDDDNRAVSICGYSFSPHEVLYEMDSDSYYSEFEDWQEREVESRRDEAKYEIDRISIGDWESVEGYRIYVCEEDEEESGDTDGDKITIEDAASIYETLKAIAQEKESQEKEIQDHNSLIGDDFMNLLQIIG